MNTYEGIFYRSSIRNYPSQQVTRKKLDKLASLLKERRRLYPGISTKVTLVKKGSKLQDRLSGLVADYGKVNAPHYLIVSSQNQEGHLVDIGYSLEPVVLQLTTMNIGTCWIGKGFEDEELRTIIDIPADQRIQILIAFGPVNEGTLNLIETPNRKEVDHFLIDASEQELSDQKQQLIEALRRAPSAINGQPWRVSVEDRALHLYIEHRSKITRMIVKSMTDMNRIDGGIGLSHLEIAGNKIYQQAEAQLLSPSDETSLEYIGSLKFSNG